MFRPVIFEENCSVGIPCYESDEYRWLVWGEDDSAEDVLKKHSKCGFANSYAWFKTWSKGDGNEEDPSISVSIFEMMCCQTQKTYFLLVWDELDDFDSIFHSVALPYNCFNLLSFFNKNFIDNEDTKYIFWI